MFGPHKVYIMVACDQRLGIGKNGKLPWDLPSELTYFQKVTSKVEDPSKENMLIMGRKTWESIPEDHRPLPGRNNVVLSRNHGYALANAMTKTSLLEAMSLAGDHIENIFIIGGAELFEEALQDPHLDGVFYTEVQGIFDCDVFFPPMPEGFEKETIENNSLDTIPYSTYYFKKL